MKNSIYYLSFFASIILLNSCVFSPTIKGNGNVTEEVRDLAGFDEIKVSRGMNVYLTSGDGFKVLVRADENLLEVIETEVLGDELIVSARANIRGATAKAVYVTLPDLEKVKSTAGSNVFSEGTITANDIELSSSAGANIRFFLEANRVEANASAGANIFLDGKTKTLIAGASSGSNIKAGDLKCREAELKVSSGANLWASTSEQLMAKASSGGNIFYSGNPSSTNISKSSGGNVIKN